MDLSFRNIWRPAAKRTLLALVPAVLLASPAAAQDPGEPIYDRVSLQDVQEILLLNGLTVMTEPLDGEDLVADNRVAVQDTWIWFVYMYNCADDGACEGFEFRLAYSDVDVSLETLNDWNNRYRFTRAYRSPDGYAVLSMDVNAAGGITASNVSALLPIWRRSITRFAAMLAPADGEPGDLSPF